MFEGDVNGDMAVKLVVTIRYMGGGAGDGVYTVWGGRGSAVVVQQLDTPRVDTLVNSTDSALL